MLAIVVAASLLLRDLVTPASNYGNIACSEVEAQLAGYIAGELDQERTAQIRVHLEHCPDCHLLYREFRARARETVALPVGLHQSLAANLHGPFRWAALNQVERGDSQLAGRLK